MIRIAVVATLATGCLSEPARPDGPHRHWEQRSGASLPGPLLSPRLAYDPDRRTVLLYGGAHDDDMGDLAKAVIHGEMYELGATGDWLPICTSPAPGAPRFLPGFGYDPIRHRAIVVGGWDDRLRTNISDAVLECDVEQGTWEPMGQVPQAVAGGQALFESHVQRMWYVGGANAAGDSGQVFVSNEDGTWTTLVAAGKWSGGFGMDITYDDTAHVMLSLLQDVRVESAPVEDQMWQVDEQGMWSQVCDRCSGLDRRDASIVHIDGTGELWLLNGYDGTHEITGTAIYDHDHFVPFSDTPPGRDSEGVAYDPSRDTVVIYGGNGDSCDGDRWGDCDETWELLPD